MLLQGSDEHALAAKARKAGGYYGYESQEGQLSNEPFVEGYGVLDSGRSCLKDFVHHVQTCCGLCGEGDGRDADAARKHQSFVDNERLSDQDLEGLEAERIALIAKRRPELRPVFDFLQNPALPGLKAELGGGGDGGGFGFGTSEEEIDVTRQTKRRVGQGVEVVSSAAGRGLAVVGDLGDEDEETRIELKTIAVDTFQFSTPYRLETAKTQSISLVTALFADCIRNKGRGGSPAVGGHDGDVGDAQIRALGLQVLKPLLSLRGSTKFLCVLWWARSLILNEKASSTSLMRIMRRGLLLDAAREHAPEERCQASSDFQVLRAKHKELQALACDRVFRVRRIEEAIGDFNAYQTNPDPASLGDRSSGGKVNGGKGKGGLVGGIEEEGALRFMVIQRGSNAFGVASASQGGFKSLQMFDAGAVDATTLENAGNNAGESAGKNAGVKASSLPPLTKNTINIASDGRPRKYALPEPLARWAFRDPAFLTFGDPEHITRSLMYLVNNDPDAVVNRPQTFFCLFLRSRAEYVVDEEQMLEMQLRAPDVESQGEGSDNPVNRLRKEVRQLVE